MVGELLVLELVYMMVGCGDVRDCWTAELGLRVLAEMCWTQARRTHRSDGRWIRSVGNRVFARRILHDGFLGTLDVRVRLSVGALPACDTPRTEPTRHANLQKTKESYTFDENEQTDLMPWMTIITPRELRDGTVCEAYWE